MDRDDVIHTLNDLIETSLDGESGFQTCADYTQNPTLKTFFLEKAERCREGAAQLQQLIRQMGGDPDRQGSMSGGMHRFWMKIKASIIGLDDQEILAECERGEDAAKQSYEEALREDLPGE